MTLWPVVISITFLIVASTVFLFSSGSDRAWKHVRLRNRRGFSILCRCVALHEPDGSARKSVPNVKHETYRRRGNNKPTYPRKSVTIPVKLFRFSVSRLTDSTSFISTSLTYLSKYLANLCSMRRSISS